MLTTFEPPAPARRWRLSQAVVVAIGWSLLVAVLLPGCSVCQHARRTMCYEPLDFPWKLDRSRSLRTYRRWAVDAWNAEAQACPEFAASRDYALGFQDGFVDFIYAGGDGQPPPIPPRKYWNVAWRAPAGQAAAKQWFAGFRHGAKAARNGGYRQQATVQSSYRTVAHEEITAPTINAPLVPAEQLGPPREELPSIQSSETPAAPRPPVLNSNGVKDNEALPGEVNPRAKEQGATGPMLRQFGDSLPESVGQCASLARGWRREVVWSFGSSINLCDGADWRLS